MTRNPADSDCATSRDDGFDLEHVSAGLAVIKLSDNAAEDLRLINSAKEMYRALYTIGQLVSDIEFESNENIRMNLVGLIGNLSRRFCKRENGPFRNVGST